MDVCLLNKADLEPKYQQYKGRVVLRDDMLKDDSGSYAAFTEQGSSASQMTVGKVMDVVAELPDCARQAADAASAYTQEKTRDASTLLKLPKSECPDIRIRLPRHKWPRSWSNIEDLVVPLERNLFCHPVGETMWKILWGLGCGEVPNWRYLFVHRTEGLFLSVYVDAIKDGWKKAESESHVEEVDEADWSRTTDIFSWPRVSGMYSAWMQIERAHCWGIQEDVRITNLCQSNCKVGRIRTDKQRLSLLIWKDMRRINCSKSLHHVLDDQHLKKEELETRWENCQKHALKLWHVDIWREWVDFTFFGP